MQLLVRRAKVGDAHNILEIKAELSIQPDQAPHPGGGFVLDSDVEQIYRHIEEDIVLVAEDRENKCLGGFAVVFKHKTVMRDIWPRRGKSVLQISEEFLENNKVSWFDKLGMRSGQHYRLYAPFLALRAMEHAFKEHMLIGAAIMSEPAPNINSLHLMKRSGFQSIGSVSENVPGFDKLTSDIYVVDRETFYKAIAEPQLKRIVDRVNLREILAHKPNTSEPATVTAVSG